MSGKKKSTKPSAKKPVRRLRTQMLRGFVLAIFGGIACALFFAARPQPLSDLAGFGPQASTEESRDLLGTLEQSVKDGYAVTITEEELNHYLRDTLAGTRRGVLGDYIHVEHVAARLMPDLAEIILVHDVAGYTLTSSMYLQVTQREAPNGVMQTSIERHAGPYIDGLPKPMLGGRFGRLPVPQGFLYLSLPAFEALADVYRNPAGSPKKEIDFIEEMSRVKIEDGKLLLDPVPPMDPSIIPTG